MRFIWIKWLWAIHYAEWNLFNFLSARHGTRWREIKKNRVPCLMSHGNQYCYFGVSCDISLKELQNQTLINGDSMEPNIITEYLHKKKPPHTIQIYLCVCKWEQYQWIILFYDSFVLSGRPLVLSCCPTIKLK